MNTIISLQGIRKDYPFGKTTIPALAGIDLELKAGRFYSIVGPSGSGKTSLLHILGCMDRPTSGRFFFQGRRVDECGEIERTRLRAKRIGFVFQLFHLNPILTAIENIAVPMQFLGVEKQAARRKASDYLDKVGMSHRRDHLPSELSGGERQRVAIARALVKQPLLLLADEPTGNLDSHKGMEIMSLLRKACVEEDCTVVQATHNREMAGQADQIFFLHDGRIINS